MEQKRYGAIDGLRTLACIGIMMMHMEANNSYEISGFIYDRVIPSFTDFVFLFMTVSAFGLCCGYYEKVLKNDISPSVFYGRRFRKILPFFGVLVLMDIVLSPSRSAFYEAFADLTLLFGFLPNADKISVIGVGWFLGLVFVFYLCFPFFCTLIENKRRAWFSFVIGLGYLYACIEYFGVGRTNILYSGCFFLAGGLIYLYREEIEKWNRWIVLVVLAASIALYYIFEGNPLTKLLISACLLIYAIICSERENTLLKNAVTQFIGAISMEFYLSHMAIFRLVEKLGMNRMFGNGWLQYAGTVVLVFCGTILFSVIVKTMLSFVSDVFKGQTGRHVAG